MTSSSIVFKNNFHSSNTLLRYMLNVETSGSQSLLNVQAFQDPTAYRLKVKRPGSDESREVIVDLLETFNWLIGLTVQHIAAPQSFSAKFERDGEKRLRLKGPLKQDDAGPYWFRTVTGATSDGRKTLIIWRKLTGEPEQDNLVLDEWFTELIRPDELAFDSYEKVKLWQEIALALLKKYTERYYSFRKREWELPHLEYQDLAATDPNLLGAGETPSDPYYRILIDRSQQAGGLTCRRRPTSPS